MWLNLFRSEQLRSRRGARFALAGVGLLVATLAFVFFRPMYTSAAPDTTAPARPTIIGPSYPTDSSGRVYEQTPSVWLTGKAEANSTVTIYEGGSSLGSTKAGSTGAWRASTSPLPDGPHSLTAYATDAAGNRSLVSAAKVVVVDTTAPAAPVIIRPIANVTTNLPNITVSGTAEPLSRIAVFDGAIFLGYANTNSAGQWINTFPVAEGTHAFSATATDIAGNVSPHQITVKILTDRTAPEPPLITLPVNNSIVTGGYIRVSGTAEPGSRIQLFDGNNYVTIINTDATGKWNKSINLRDGLHVFTAYAQDAARNISNTSLNRRVTMDTVPPAQPAILSPTSPITIPLGTVTLQGTADPNVAVIISDHDTPVVRVYANSGGNWVRTLSRVPDGEHKYTVTAYDVAGNPSPKSNAIIVHAVTDAAPRVSSTTPANNARSVGTSAPIIVNFSEPVNVVGSSFALQCPVGTPRGILVNPPLPASATSFTITPKTPLPTNTACALIIPSSRVWDVDTVDPPDRPAADFVLNFTTDSPPYVTSRSPIQGATDVALNAKVTINFSEPVNVTNGSFDLQCPNGTSIPFTLSPAAPGGVKSFTLTPNAPLPNATFCRATVAAATVTDVDSGDPPDTMIANYATSFTTIAVNDAPSFTKGADQTVLEDAGPQSVANWATAISPGPADEVGQTVAFTVTNNTNTALFSAGPAVAPDGTLTYTTAPNANGSATITLVAKDNGGTANGGVDTSAPQTFTISVTPVNDAPSFTKGADQTVLEDAGQQRVSRWATALSPGADNEGDQNGAFIVTNNTNPSLFSVAPALDTEDRMLTYTPAADAFGTATITLVLKDDGGTANGGADTSAPQTFTITVTPVNDAPSFTKGEDQTVREDSGAQTVAAWATDISVGPNESGQALTFALTNTNTTLFSAGPAVAADGTLTYTPAVNAFGTATVTVTLSDDGGVADGGVNTSAPQTFTITITPVNDAPSFTKGTDQSVPENSGAQTVAAWATSISAGPNESGQALTFALTTTNTTLFSAGPAVAANGTLTYTPAPGVSGTATVTVTLSDDGGTADGGVNTSAPQTFTITVERINHAPSFTKGGDQTVLEDAGPQTVSGWATAIDANDPAQFVTFDITNNDNLSLFSGPVAVASDGTLTYTPAADANGSATLTLVAKDDGGTADGGVDTSASQTFTITVTPVNDVPSFTKGADQTVLEDSGAQTVAAWATSISAGPNESGQALTFALTTTNTTLFSAGPAVAANGTLTYTPAPGVFGTATVTVTLSDDGGTADGGVNTSAPQTFTITVERINHAPSFTKGADQTVLEDAGLQTVSGWATAIDANDPGQVVTFEITNNDNPSLFNGPVAVASDGTLTYTPAANANGSATLTLVAKDDGGTAFGGVDTSVSQTFTITVTPVNDAPSFTKGADQTVLEDSAAQSVANWATAMSPGPADESGQEVGFIVTNNTNAALFSAGPAVAADGTLTYTPAANAFGTATISLAAKDDGGVADGGADTSASQTFVITITPVNDIPSFTKGVNQTALEDAGAQTVAAWATAISAGPNESGQEVGFIVTNNTNTALFSAGPAVATNGTLTYTPAANANGTATITLVAKDNGGTADGGADTSASQTFTITVTPVNDAPSFTKGADQTVLEDPGAQSVANWATAMSPGPVDESGQEVGFIVTNNTNTALFSAGPAVAADGTLTYTPAPNAFGTATISMAAKDDGGTANGGVDTSTSQTFTITVTPVNDAPLFTKGADQTVLEDAGPQSVTGWATAISGGPNEVGQTVSFTVTNNTNTALFSAAPAVAANGTLTYTPAADANGSATLTLVAKDDGGTANGGVDTSAPQTFTINVTPVNDAPVVPAKSYDTVGNTMLQVAATKSVSPAIFVTGTLLTGVTDIDGPGPNTASLKAATSGAVVTINSDGTFTYLPPAGKTGTDTFTYEVNDGDGGIGTGTVTITLVQRVWYVNNNAPVSVLGSGLSSDPFSMLVDAELASSDGDVIFVFAGTGTTKNQDYGISLKTNQYLLGEGVGLILNGTLNGVAGPTTIVPPGVQPRIAKTVGNGNGVTILNATGVTVRGLNISGIANAIDVTSNGSGSAGATISNNTISGAGNEGIDVNAGGIGTFVNVSSNTLTATGNAFDARTTSGNLEVAFSDNTNITSGATGVLIDGSAGGTTRVSAFANNTVHGNTVGTGISITSASFDALPAANFQNVAGGTSTIGTSGNAVGGAGMVLTNVSGDLSFSDLDIYADGGAALKASGTTAYTGAAGFQMVLGSDSVVNAKGGPAVDLSQVKINFPLSELKSDTSPTTGVSLANVTGTFTAGTSSSITASTGTNFYVNGGAPTVTYRGTISDATGQLVFAANTSSTSLVFSGQISDNASGTGGGIALSANPSAAIEFSSVQLSTGASTAFSAANSGTLKIADTNNTNTIATTTATALNIVDTTIHTDGVKFKSISAGTAVSGPTNGILLNNTGTSGGLTVAGTGSAGSGGTIQKATGSGISLTKASKVSLNRMTVTGNGNSGILGSSVTDLTINSLSISNNGDAVNEGGIRLVNLWGTSSIAATTVSGSAEDNIFVSNDSGTLTGLTIQGGACTIQNNSSTLGNDGVNIMATATAVMKVTVSSCQFTGNRTDAIHADAAGTASLDVTLDNNTFVAGSPNQGNIGIEVTASGSANVTYNVFSNVVGVTGPLLNTGINIFAGNTSTMVGKVQNNQVKNNGTGSGFGIRVFQSLDSKLRANVSGNIVSNVALDYGILVEASGATTAGASRVDVAVTGNNVSVLSSALDAIRVQARNANTLCGRINTNTTNAGGTINGFFGLFVRQANTAVFNLEGLAGGAQTAAAARAALVAQNSAAATVDAVATTNFTGVAANSCNIP